MQKEFIIEEMVPRIDVWLAATLGVSRSAAQRMVKDELVKVNGKAVTPHFALKAGVRVTVDEAPEAAPYVPTNIPLDIIHEDDAIMVVNKPFGMLVHETPGKERGTLAELAMLRHPEMAGIGESPERPGIVHRLDKDASGVIVLARTQPAYDALKKQFQEHTIKKEYAVLVFGQLTKDEGTINLSIGRSSGRGTMAARAVAHKGDRDAITHYRVDQRFRDATLVTVRTETGRTHQIRTHFKAIGYPVVGDPLYKIKHDLRVNSPRMFLHAKLLGFTHPTSGEQVEFTAPLPTELEDVLSKIAQ